MKKLLTVLLLILTVFAMTGCGGEEDPFTPDKIKIEDICGGSGDYFVINGECVLKDQVVSDRISIHENETIIQYLDSVELMTDFVADLTGSTGLAVVPRGVFDAQTLASTGPEINMMKLAVEMDTLNQTENIIVKLTEEGFFEEVGFTNEQGLEVTISSNPLALEVFGAYTIVVFEVDLGYENQVTTFSQKIFDSLHAGGIYLIHNESGKMFATKNIEYMENTSTYQEDHSRNINIMVTLNQPVIETQQIPRFDEFGNPIFDEFGGQFFDEVQVPVLDSEGNPLIFTEGPILTEMLNVPLVEHFKIQQVDDDGNLVVDENGNPVYDYVDEPILNENGDPIFQIQEVPVLDENGNIQYQQEFTVDLFIEDIRVITMTQYFAQVTENPISGVAQRFVDQILAEYYNWNYYRVNNYMISSWGFSASDEDIFFTENKENATDPSKYDRYVMRLSFDSETNELLLEEYINATKAGFNECELILDPRNNNIICDSWDSNIKIYSPITGLKTIPDSENLNPVTFPNGDLYFYDYNQTYIEELGYYTTLLYTINSDGTLESSYIELGEREDLCYSPLCNSYISVDMYDMQGNQYHNDGYNYDYVNVQQDIGDMIVSNADLQLTQLGSFDASRPACTDSNGCWYNVLYDIYDGETLIGSFDGSVRVYPGETVPAYKETYQVDEFTQIDYQLQWSNIDKVCENGDVGCIDNFYMVDESINTYGLWIYGNSLIQLGDTYIDQIKLNETNNAVYDYSKDVTGIVCEYTTCDEYVQVRIYDDQDKLLSETYTNVQIAQGETIPLYIEYRMTENTTVTEKSTVCTTSSGCWYNYETFDGTYYGINYPQGSTIYETIVFVESDKTEVTQKTLTNAVCTDPQYCYGNEIEYIILDDLGNELYHFSQWANAEFGSRIPFTVTATLDDVTITTEKESLTEVALCETATCRLDISLSRKTSTGETYLGWGTLVFTQGEQIINRIMLAQDAIPSSTISEQMCNIDEGCVVYTNNFTILDDEDNELQLEGEMYNSLPVFFAKGDIMPVDSSFSATFTMSNIEYRMMRMNVYDFINNLNNVVILDDNLYLIERESWTAGQDNVILTYDETNDHYLAMYTNLSAVTEITKLGEAYVAINDDETAIYKFEFNVELSDNNYYQFDVTNLTDGLSINGVNDLIIDYDGSIYFKGVDNFIQDITGSITGDGVVNIDTEYVEHEIIRLRPIN